MFLTSPFYVRACRYMLTCTVTHTISCPNEEGYPPYPLCCIHILTHVYTLKYTQTHKLKAHIPESKQHSPSHAAPHTSTAASSTAIGTGQRHCRPAATKHMVVGGGCQQPCYTRCNTLFSYTTLPGPERPAEDRQRYLTGNGSMLPWERGIIFYPKWFW